ncbi:MAG: hypothetical protein A2583_06770 [Bdellovibrionales bacterium RIFOXYD1_FULL_53_11]|nr:MAG: hypothetical protein A2583_06770 [Bdellovibrionales bacterium RIFOXYD1_FULL_53_11]
MHGSFFPVVVGLLAAIVVFLVKFAGAAFAFIRPSQPVIILGVALFAMIAHKFIFERRADSRNYNGIPDLFVHIHASSGSDMVLRWVVRGIVSFFLALAGGIAGPEGAAIEFAHASATRARVHTSRWFEQRRRTDAAVSLAAGVSAAFGAPFAAVILPMELGIGGRGISVALASLAAFTGGRLLVHLSALTGYKLEGFDLGGVLYGYRMFSATGWVAIAVIALAGGLAGAALVRFIGYSRASFIELFRTRVWMRIVAGGVLLFLAALAYKNGNMSSWTAIENILWNRIGLSESGLLLLSKVFCLVLVLSAFGTAGIFWPVIAIGAVLGHLVDRGLFGGIPGFSAIAGLAGATALAGAVIGSPVAVAVAAFEMTQNVQVLVPCLVAGIVARWVRRLVRASNIIDADLDASGLGLVDGRSASVLSSLFVRDAMITDFESVAQQEPVSGIYSRLAGMSYPFIPVISANGGYVGMLTADMVQESWRVHKPSSSESPLSKLLEAKDLLYRSKVKVPAVRLTDKLNTVARMLGETPCLPVVDENGKMVGLLFAYNVRLVYEREVERRAITKGGMR